MNERIDTKEKGKENGKKKKNLKDRRKRDVNSKKERYGGNKSSLKIAAWASSERPPGS